MTLTGFDGLAISTSNKKIVHFGNFLSLKVGRRSFRTEKIAVKNSGGIVCINHG
jgi:hypothetical protein